jgi:hypothetical protein
MTITPTESGDIALLKRQLEQEANRRGWLENLIAEAIQHRYLDHAACPPTWLAEAERATTAMKPPKEHTIATDAHTAIQVYDR